MRCCGYWFTGRYRKGSGGSNAVTGADRAMPAAQQEGRADILQIESATIGLFERAAPSVVQVVSVFALTDDESVSVAWWAHIGGFATGLVITFLLRGRLRERLDSQLKVASDLPNAGQGVDSARVPH